MARVPPHGHDFDTSRGDRPSRRQLVAAAAGAHCDGAVGARGNAPSEPQDPLESAQPAILRAEAAQEDYAGAAALQEQARLDATAEAKHRQKQAIEAHIKKRVAQEDYAGAAALQEQARLDATAEAKHGEKQDVEAQIKRRRA